MRSRLQTIPPGPELVAALLADPVQRRAAAGRIDAIAAWDRVIAWAQAAQLAELAAFGHEHPISLMEEDQVRSSTVAQLEQTMVDRFAADELSAALHVSRRSAATRLDTALDLHERLPAVHDALSKGQITLPQARSLAEGTRALESSVSREVVTRLLPQAARQTWGQLNAALGKAVLAADPASAEARHVRQADERRVVYSPQPDGMAWLSLYTTAEVAAAGWTAVTALAEAGKSSGAEADDTAERRSDGVDRRDMDARRADALADLLVGALDAPTLSRRQHSGPNISVVVPVGTLLGVDDAPGELAGYGPIPASLARRIAADGTWRRLLTDPVSGALLDVGTTRYSPPAALARFVRARDRTCRFPGCRADASSCEIDHTSRYPEGPTSCANLGPLCPHHHHLKHSGRWQLEQPSPGRFVWTAPTGHSYVVEAQPPGPVRSGAPRGPKLSRALSAPPGADPPF